MGFAKAACSLCGQIIRRPHELLVFERERSNETRWIRSVRLGDEQPDSGVRCVCHPCALTIADALAEMPGRKSK